MTKPANKTRGEVGLSEAGDGCVLRFTNDAMERLFSEFGEKYVDETIRKVGAVDPNTFKMALECMIEGDCDIEKRPWGLTWNELNERILDAIFLSLHGRTFKQQQEFLESESEKDMKEAEKVAAEGNPQKAALILSRAYARLGLLPNSSPMKSED